MEIFKLEITTFWVAIFFMIEISSLKKLENKIATKNLEKISFFTLSLYMGILCLSFLGFLYILFSSGSIEEVNKYIEYIHKFYEHIYIFFGLLFIELIYFIKYREFEALKALILKFAIYFGIVFVIIKG